MSSGLMYLAIVGVWALVLVPMWLRGNETGERSRARLLARRHSPTAQPARRASRGPRDPTPPDGGVPGQASGQAPEHASEHAHATRVAPGEDVRAMPDDRPDTPGQDGAPAWARPPVAQPAAASAQAGADRLPGGRGRARVMARRRRRLFGISLLSAAAVILVMSRLAPSWVIGPPAVLLVAYVAVLRAAGQIDAERRQALTVRARAATPYVEADETVPAGPEAPADTDAEVIELAPGGRGADEPYDQYADAGLRAVGD